jgi:hypothetical protein
MVLATAERASRSTFHIDKHCASCGAIENDAHIFFLCTLPQQVWANSNTTLSPHQINPDLDGVQHNIPQTFHSNSIEATLFKTLLLLWYLWKARNDHRFQRKTWTSL